MQTSVHPAENRVEFATQTVSRAEYAILGAILSGVLAVHATSISGGMWYDEVKTANAAKLPLVEMVAERADAGHTPLYFAICWAVTRLFGDSEVALRMPAALFGLGSAALLYCMVRRLASPSAALLATALFVFNPTQVFLCQQARPYTLTQLLCLATTYLMVLNSPRRREVWLCGVLWYISFYTHYSVFLVFVPQVIVLLWLRNWTYLRSAMASVIAYTPWLFYYHSVRTVSEKDPLGFLRPITLDGVLKIVAELEVGKNLPQEIDNIGMLAFWGLAVVGALALRRGRMMTFCVCLGPLVLMVLAALLSDTGLMRNRRYFATTLALLTALSAVGIVELAKSLKTKPIAAIGTAIVVFFTSWGLYRHYSESPHKPWREMARTIQGQARRDELVVVPGGRHAKIPFGYYFDGSFTQDESFQIGDRSGAWVCVMGHPDDFTVKYWSAGLKEWFQDVSVQRFRSGSVIHATNRRQSAG